MSWRKGIGEKRFLVGEFTRDSLGIRFQYLDEAEQAKEQGFICYPEFPDLNKEYSQNILEIISTRIIRSSRETDKKRYLDFWQASSPNLDNYDIIGMTQGWLPTDHFEFLGLFNPIQSFSFITDVAGLTYSRVEKGFLKIGDKLNYSFDPMNKFDNKAVKLLYEDENIGFIKRIHNLPFHSAKRTPSLTIVALENNSVLKRAFIKVSF